MPYIAPENRHRIDQAIGFLPQTLKVGEMNYAITRIVDKFLTDHGYSYTQINAAIGVLECAKLELYRRLAAPYEDVKCAENGDAYTVQKK